MNGMTTVNLNRFFTEKNDFLLSYALKKCQKFKRNYSPEEVISEIYLKLHRKEFESIEHLEGVTLTFIRNEIALSNSGLNYIKKKDATVDLVDMAIEEEKSNPIIEYYKATKNIEHKCLLEAYLELGHDTHVKLSNYFGLSTTTINKLFKEIKENILIINKKQIQ
jgi:hypothetical protein